MNLALWKKAIRESYLLWLGCAAVLYLFCWVRVWITSRLEMGRFQNILENLPDSWQRLAPVPIEQLFSYEGRIAVTYEEPVVYLMMALWTIARSSDAVSGGLGRGTLEMLLAQPVSRMQIIWTHTSATLVGVLLLAMVAYAGTYTGISTTTVVEPTPPVNVFGINIPLTGGQPVETPMREKVDPSIFLSAAANYFGLGVFLVGLTTFLSSWDRYRWRTIGITVAFYVIETVLELLALAVDGFGWVKSLTFFAAYEPIRFISESVGFPERHWGLVVTNDQGVWVSVGPVGANLILIGLGALGILVATIIFCRRDLPAPV